MAARERLRRSATHRSFAHQRGTSGGARDARSSATWSGALTGKRAGAAAHEKPAVEPSRRPGSRSLGSDRQDSLGRTSPPQEASASHARRAIAGVVDATFLPESIGRPRARTPPETRNRQRGPESGSNEHDPTPSRHAGSPHADQALHAVRTVRDRPCAHRRTGSRAPGLRATRSPTAQGAPRRAPPRHAPRRPGRPDRG